MAYKKYLTLRLKFNSHRKGLTKNTAYNERFGATAAVTPLKVTCEHERKYPAERLVSAAAFAKPLGR